MHALRFDHYLVILTVSLNVVLSLGFKCNPGHSLLQTIYIVSDIFQKIVNLRLGVQYLNAAAVWVVANGKWPVYGFGVQPASIKK